MPKPNTHPILFDNVLQIHIKKLKEWGYINPIKIINATLNWSINGNKIGSISLIVNTTCNNPYLELLYTHSDISYNYIVNLISVPSNLGKGELWFFICPKTGKRCRKLYCIDGYFLHRDAFNGIMYQSQIYSKKWREMSKIYGDYFSSERIYEQLYKKHLKKTYRGRPTKKYAKLALQIKKAENISDLEIENQIVKWQ
ncbi:MAG: hypothetical protein BM557_09900 [Flavobacterium sp. MedPE-SWcel]|uniref:hypothetical protein n=1 Tax=uncultured Flavobacterium sp. TaxID=165435 RepID=UPI000910DFA4|nr:hypothetical protein [uncultured Flavobacterium sp.]OIQ16615.1 MAG: hypothetical protein BM557_09900 [Flavobacterium sp. MedPE-SWcel]